MCQPGNQRERPGDSVTVMGAAGRAASCEGGADLEVTEAGSEHMAYDEAATEDAGSARDEQAAAD